MELAALTAMVAEDAALRRRRTLQPVGGVGGTIFPPTYPGEGRNAPPRHVYERRRGADEAGRAGEVWCVLVDSVQSQANRLEESLLDAIREGAVAIPFVEVDFSGEGLDGISAITSLDAPHRIYDAILRDSVLEGEPFMKSAVGESLKKAKPENATAVLETSPTALLFGAWHSTGEGGGIGAKFARALVSEIVAVDVPVDFQERRGGELMAFTAGGGAVQVEPVTTGRRTGSRIDPLGVLRRVEVFKGEAGWDVSKQGAGKNAKQVRPSEINHGNIAPSVQRLGITCAKVEHSFVLSFAALRRLRFGGGARDAAGRTLLAALGLLALAEQDARGYALRSRCDLVPEGPQGLEQVRADGTTAPVALDRTEARALYAAALAAARKAGFSFRDGPLVLKPQAKLVAIVKESQTLALKGEGGEADGDTA